MRFAAFAVLLIVTACQAPPAEMTEAEKAQIEAEVEAFFVEFTEAWEAVDLDRGLSLYVQTPEAAWAMDGRITHGFDAIDEEARAFYSSFSSGGGPDWTNNDVHFVVLSRNAVAVLDVGTVGQSNPEGVTPESTSIYTYTYVLVRRDGEWKLLLGQGAFVTN